MKFTKIDFFIKSDFNIDSLGTSKESVVTQDHKKHEISKHNDKPVTGVCMCDLYQYRTRLRTMEMVTTTVQGSGITNWQLLQTPNGTIEFFLIFPPSFFVKSVRLGVSSTRMISQSYHIDRFL
jgi:hypothetical protein